jgi:hypothetical protein
MSLTLTPEQQAALEAFDKASDDSLTAQQANDDAQYDLAQATTDANDAALDALDKATAAVEAGKAFVDLMLAREPAPLPDPLAPGGTEPTPAGNRGTRGRHPRPVGSEVR